MHTSQIEVLIFVRGFMIFVRSYGKYQSSVKFIWTFVLDKNIVGVSNSRCFYKCNIDNDISTDTKQMNFCRCPKYSLRGKMKNGLTTPCSVILFSGWHATPVTDRCNFLTKRNPRHLILLWKFFSYLSSEKSPRHPPTHENTA